MGDAGFAWVGFYISHCFQVVRVVLDGKAFIAALVDVAYAAGSVGGMPSLSMGSCYPLHEIGESIVSSGPEDQVPVV